MNPPGQATVYLSVAGNIAPEEHLPKAIDRLRETGKITAISTFYRTPALDRPDQPDYLNGVIRMECALPPRVLKYSVLRGIEADLGRVRGEDRYAARPIDLDILLFGDRVLREEGLEIPDPDLIERPFLAAGVLELAPKLMLPGNGRPMKEMVNLTALQRLCPDVAFTKDMKARFSP